MNNPFFRLRVPAIVAIACVSILAALPASADNANKPNIVFIMADDLGYGDIGCFGQKTVQTPNLDKLAAEGMRLTRHYSGSTVCAPSRCVLMTGLHTGHCFIRGNATVPLRPEDVTVAELLKEQGYATGLVGKWGLGEAASTGTPNKQGFDYFFGYYNQVRAHNYYPRFLWRNDQRVMLRNIVKTTTEGYAKGVGGAATKRIDYSHDRFTAEAMDFVRNHRSEPFFLYLAYTIPHANNEAPGVLNEHGMEVPGYGRYAGEDWPEAKKGQAAMITRLDSDVGALVRVLDELNLSGNTLVIFTSDNGPHKEGGGDPEFFDANGPLRGIKRDLYEGGIRVPTIARWPGKIAPGSVSDHVSGFHDFLATACDVAGVKIPEKTDGISYLPTLLGQEQPAHDYLYWEFVEQGGKQAILKGKWKAIRLNVRRNPDGPIELYDLENDLGETQNVAAANRDVIREMAGLFKSARTSSREFRLIPASAVTPALSPELTPRPPLPSVYLSDLKPLKAESGAEALGAPKMDQSIRGEPLKAARKTFAKGIGVHAPSEVVFALKPEYKRFVSLAAVDDARPGSVIFEVYFDDKRAFRTHPIFSNDIRHVNLAIPAGAKTLRLVVTDGGNGNRNDHADWLNAGFLVE